MKYFLLILLIISLVYLSATYAYFYNYIGAHFLVAPATELTPLDSQKPKFVTLGDSFMAGVGSSSSGDNLSNLLYKQADPKGEMDLVNLAVPGATIRKVLTGQLPEVFKDNPEIVVILIGVNDIHDFIKLSRFEKDYRELISELTSKTSSKIILINIPYLGSNKILLPPWNSYMDFKAKQFNSVIERIAKENNLKMVDLYSLSRDKFQKTSGLYSVDQFHPSDEGYRVWANFISENSLNAN